MNFQVASCFILVFLVSFSNESAVSCSHSNDIYQLCLLDKNNNLVNTPKSFTANELKRECHEHFVEHYLGKICDDHDQKETRGFQQNYILEHIPGIIAVLIVSILSFIGLLILPILHKTSFEHTLNLLTSVSVGTLLGDAMFHLIPFIMGLHTHDHDHGHDHHHDHPLIIPSYQWKLCLAVFILYLFYLLEVFLHWLAHHKQNLSLSHSHSHDYCNKSLDNYHYAQIKPNPHLQLPIQTPSIYSNAKSFFNTNSLPCTPFVDGKEFNLDNINPCIENENISLPSKIFTEQFPNELDVTEPTVEKTTIKSTGWMILFDDSIHNFTNGLALNVAFSHNIFLGIATTIAVTFYRLRHEIGDYTVLLHSGFSHRRALLWNFLSVISVFLGFSLGSAISTDENTRQWIFVLTIGMFIHIALVDMLPTLLADGQVEFKRFLIVNSGFILGVMSMFVLAVFEEN